MICCTINKMRYLSIILITLGFTVTPVFSVSAQEADVDQESIELWSEFIELNRAYSGAAPVQQTIIREKMQRMIYDTRANSFAPFGTESGYLLKFGDWLRNNVYYVNDYTVSGRSGPYVTRDGSEAIHDICYSITVSNRFTPVKTYPFKVRFNMNKYGKLTIVSIKNESECRFGRPPKEFKNLTGGLFKTSPVSTPALPDFIPPVPVTPVKPAETPIVESGVDDCETYRKDARRYKNEALRSEKGKAKLSKTVSRLDSSLDSLYTLLSTERVTNAQNQKTIRAQEVKIDSLTLIVNYLQHLVDSTFCKNGWKAQCEDADAWNQAISDFNYYEQNMQLRPREEQARMIQQIYQKFRFSQCHTCIRPEEYCVMGKILLYYYSFIQDLLPGDDEQAKKNFRISKIYEILNKGANLGPDYADTQCFQQIAEDLNVVMEDRTQDNIEMIMSRIISDIKAGKFAGALYRYSVYQYEFPKYSENQTSMELDMYVSKVLLWDLGNISANKGSLRPGTWAYRVYNETGFREEFSRRKLSDIYNFPGVNENLKGECYILLQKFRK